MERCPRCLLEFYSTKDVCSIVDSPTRVYAHECSSGFIRPYPQIICSDCGPSNEDTVLMSLAEIERINESRKRAKYINKELDPLDSDTDYPETREIPVG